jgi:CubicO group peptidase (beta-lactamase class C family)
MHVWSQASTPGCSMVLHALLVAVLLPLPQLALSQARVTDPEDAHIHRVEAGLLPIAATRDKLGSHETIGERLRAYGVAGLSVAVIDEGRIAWAKGYGVADTTTGQAVTPETLFQAGSISKPIAALGALLLVERGKLDLDGDVNRYLRKWKVPTNAFTAAHPVTLRTLLDHSAALTDLAFENYEPGRPLPALSDVLQSHWSAIRVESEPGRQYSYSGTGYVVLQQLMMDTSGQPFDTFMTSQVLRPLGMTRSTYANPIPTSLQQSAAMGHYSGGERIPGGYRVGPESAVGGLWTTPSDIARYIIEVQEWYADSRRGLISPRMTQQMLSPQIGYAGLGVVLSGSGEDLRFGHDGFNEGFECAMVGYVRAGRGAVVMANSGFSYMLIKEVLGSIARVYEWPHYDSTNQWPPSAAIRQQEIARVPNEVTAQAVGHYSLDANTSVRVFAKDQRLFIHWPRSGKAEIFQTPDERLFCPQLTFSELGNPFLRLRAAKHGAPGELLGADDQVVMQAVK